MSERIAIITGSEGGIGRALILSFINAGYKVVGIDIFPQKNVAESGYDYYCVDISSPGEVKDCFDSIKTKYSTAHIIINNAAIANFRKHPLEITPEEFSKVINTNLCGTFYCCREFLRINKGESFGRIINISSTRFNQNEEGWEAYGASKGGVVSLTNSLAVSLSDTPVTVNAISPGWIETKDYESLSQSDHKQHPSGRVGRPDDISRVALFLCNEENDFINAQNIIVDGGMTKKMIYED